MSGKRRSHGDGAIDARGADIWRLRYRIAGVRHTVSFHGSLSDARRELRNLLKSGDDGSHIAPTRIAFTEWVKMWLALREHKLNHRSYERYEELLRLHVLPTLGKRLLREIT